MYLHANNDSVQVQHWLPVLSQDIQAHLALQIDIRVVDLLLTAHLWRVVGEVLVDVEVEGEFAALVHALVGLDAQYKIEDIVRVREFGFHR